MANIADRADRADVVIAGAGHVGRSLALALKTLRPGLRVIVLDPEGSGRLRPGDDRASAISAAARRMLQRLGVWDALTAVAQPMIEMVITDSALRDVVRPHLLTIEGPGEADEAFAHMVPNTALADALADRLEGMGIEVIEDAARLFDDSGPLLAITLASGRLIETRLLAAADGADSRLRALAGIGTVGRTYHQMGLVATVEHERPHQGRAVQHFLPAGPFAILPLKGNRSSIVWTEDPDVARHLIAFDDFTFSLELERRFGAELGWVRAAGSRLAYPLRLQLARRYTAPRFALVGDAAHTIHPLAGQGLNLGFRDAAALADLAAETAGLGLDFGAADVLERYDRWRRVDVVRMGALTDGLNRLFSNDADLVRFFRSFGLQLVDRSSALKRTMMNEAAGLGGRTPSLMADAAA